jgi:hypothetical protein
LLLVASTEGIDVSRKLALAGEEVGADLTVLLGKLRYSDQAYWAAPVPGLENVVVTKPLRLWHTYRALEMVYRDAYNSQLNDRYAGKRDQFHDLGEIAYERLIHIGLGIAARPIPQAMPPTTLPIPGALADGTYYVSAAWVNEGGEEGASSEPTVATITGSTFQADAGPPPANAAGWNVYVGDGPESMVLQNGSPIAAGQVWQASGPLVTSGKAPGSGQEPTYLKPVPRLILRG